MFLLDNPVRSYAWGSVDALPELLGLGHTGHPQAELWLGAHPMNSSSVLGPGGGRLLLSELITDQPERLLGAPVVAAYGPTLPFLLKVLAVEAPLSIQAHPTRSQAEAGFGAEEAAGVPRDAAHRNYRDPHPKPELVHAVTDFDALIGFRPVAATLELLAALDVAGLYEATRPLRERRDRQGLADTVRALLELDPDDATTAVSELAKAAAGPAASAYPVETATLLDLAQRYPSDAGVLVAVLLDRVRLDPRQTLFVPAGVPHAYLRGVAVELQAASDNTLRGGLTPKHVDVPALLAILDTEPRVVPLTDATPGDPGEQVYVPPVPEFRLSRIDVAAAVRTLGGAGAPQILLTLDGEVRVATGATESMLGRGDAVFVGADEGPIRLRGHGTVFRATTNG